MDWRKFISPAFICALVVGCGQAPQDQGTAPAQRGVQSETYRAQDQEGFVRKRTQRAGGDRAEFLNRIRSADPQFQTIQKALLNDRNELGIILNRDVDMASIPTLMRSLLTQMAKEFPGEDHTVIAYAPTQPPMKIGTGRLDANTREMTYTPAR